MSDTEYIALVCKDRSCDVAIVSPRELSRVNGTLTDPDNASSVRLYCIKHSVEGDYPEYYDKYGHQVSGDPEADTTVTDMRDYDPDTNNRSGASPVRTLDEEMK